MKKVAIIGAGFTGLTAGYELAKKGVDVTIFEKSSDIGGLAGGFTLEGASLEKAYHHLFRTDTAILSLLDELGLSKELGWYESKVGMIVK
ncbi:amine oxidase, partial [Candidatus Dojkabacteria bacterium CG_4_10_14_3_um_filter_Dojkabacteria_WS6_41_9]